MFKEKNFDYWEHYKEKSKLNKDWDKSNLHRPYSIGSDMKLIWEKEPSTYKEWEEYFFETGDKRKKILASMSEDDRLKSNNFEAVQDKNILKTYSYDIKKLNYNFGRTESDLVTIAKMFMNFLEKNSLHTFTLDDCIEEVYFHTIYETWIGYQFEYNIMQYINNTGKKNGFITKHASDENDSKFSIDFEVFYKNKLFCAIQLKPHTYFLGHSDSLTLARQENFEKHNQFFNKYGVEVVFIAYNKETKKFTHTFRQEKLIDKDTGYPIPNVAKEFFNKELSCNFF